MGHLAQCLIDRFSTKRDLSFRGTVFFNRSLMLAAMEKVVWCFGPDAFTRGALHHMDYGPNRLVPHAMLAHAGLHTEMRVMIYVV